MTGIHPITLPAMTTLRQALQVTLDKHDGLIAFEEFMRLSLYHPQDGYYARNIHGIGINGDFTTVPQKSPQLGPAIAHWLRSESSRRNWKKFHVIECGPGSGMLAAQVMKNFGWWERRHITWHLVETSLPLREQQRKRLRGYGVKWHNSIAEALIAAKGCALIYHNEFFDAFPCRVFQMQTNRWRELFLRVRDGRLTEEWIDQKLPESTVFENTWPEGQRVEVFAAVHNWLQETTEHWREGAMLAIDYGGKPEAIYHRRPRGTLRAYRQQQRCEGSAVYELPGKQDITADVNFDDLTRWAREIGWLVTPFKSLSRFAPGAPVGEEFQVVCFSK
jgi:SAM-dependent MidA family methyltransferase